MIIKNSYDLEVCVHILDKEGFCSIKARDPLVPHVSKNGKIWDYTDVYDYLREKGWLITESEYFQMAKRLKYEGVDWEYTPPELRIKL